MRKKRPIEGGGREVKERVEREADGRRREWRVSVRTRDVVGHRPERTEADVSSKVESPWISKGNSDHPSLSSRFSRRSRSVVAMSLNSTSTRDS